MRKVMAAVGLCLALVPSIGYAAAKPVRVLLLELRTTSVDRESVLGIVPLIASEAAKPPFQLITSNDVAAVLGVEKRKQLMGCTDSSCIQEIGGALDARYLIAPEVSAIGGIHVLSVVVLDGAKGQPISRVTRLVPKEKGVGGLVEVVSAAVAEAMSPARAKEGGAAPAPAAQPVAAKETPVSTTPASSPEKKVEDVETAKAPAAATAPAVQAQVQPAWTGPGPLHTAGYVADAIGAAGLVAGIIVDALAMADHASAKSILSGGQGDEAAFNGAKSSFETKRTAAGALYVGGAVVLAAGLVMTLIPEKSAEAPRVGLGVTPDGGGFVSVTGVWR